jgi:hypothetical protein
MLATLFDHLTPPPAPPKLRLRERRYECGWYRRKVKGEKYQVRWWVEGCGSVNCGLYDEADAGRVYDELIHEVSRHPLTALGVWQALRVVLAKLKKRYPSRDWPNVLPMYVRAAGEKFAAKVKKSGRVLECAGPFDSPEGAHLAIIALLAKEFPRSIPATKRTLVTLVDFLAK